MNLPKFRETENLLLLNANELTIDEYILDDSLEEDESEYELIY
jgi:hypothetical protein